MSISLENCLSLIIKSQHQTEPKPIKTFGQWRLLSRNCNKIVLAALNEYCGYDQRNIRRIEKAIKFDPSVLEQEKLFDFHEDDLTCHPSVLHHSNLIDMIPSAELSGKWSKNAGFVLCCWETLFLGGTIAAFGIASLVDLNRLYKSNEECFRIFAEGAFKILNETTNITLSEEQFQSSFAQFISLEGRKSCKLEVLSCWNGVEGQTVPDGFNQYALQKNLTFVNPLWPFDANAGTFFFFFPCMLPSALFVLNTLCCVPRIFTTRKWLYEDMIRKELKAIPKYLEKANKLEGVPPRFMEELKKKITKYDNDLRSQQAPWSTISARLVLQVGSLASLGLMLYGFYQAGVEVSDNGYEDYLEYYKSVIIQISNCAYKYPNLIGLDLPKDDCGRYIFNQTDVWNRYYNTAPDDRQRFQRNLTTVAFWNVMLLGGFFGVSQCIKIGETVKEGFKFDLNIWKTAVSIKNKVSSWMPSWMQWGQDPETYPLLGSKQIE